VPGVRLVFFLVCANYRPVTRSDRMLTFFGVERDRDDPPADVWPMGMAPFLRLSEDGSSAKWVADNGLFGLLPHFAVEVAEGRRTYNARSETVAKLPSFREAWRSGWRCIIPAEHIYEPCWEGGKCVRWQIQGPGATPFGIAGIYRRWRGPDGREVFTFSMLTVNAAGHPVMSRFHKPDDEKRMVVILDPKDYGEWLGCPVDEAPKFFRQWMGPLEAFPNELPPRAPKASSVRTSRPADPNPPLDLF
jgi:putative SOS response-associated peptidase YedK